MRPSVALATCDWLPELDPEDGPLLLPALAAAGLDATPQVWSDPSVDWTAYDLVVVRTTWDYVLRREEFLGWAAAVPRLANPLPVLTWSSHKGYLLDLLTAGVPTVPTVLLRPGDDVVLPPGEVVVKPAVSAASIDTTRHGSPQRAEAHVRSLLDAGRDVVVQPYLERVDVEGETSVLLFDGEVSHAASKQALLNGPVEQPIGPSTATAGQVEAARAALACAPGPALYARVDLLPTPDGPVVLEVELVEPSLFLPQAPGAAERFAAAVARAVAAQSSGPPPTPAAGPARRPGRAARRAAPAHGC